MTSSTTRSALVAAVACLAVGAAACTPPNENPSDKKVDTATEQNADSLPGSQISGTDTTNTNVAEAEATKESDRDAQRSSASSPDGNPRYVDCNGDLKERPNKIVLDCKNQDDELTDIVWESWDADTAVGTGVRKTSTPDREPEDNIRIVLSNPAADDNGELVFDNQITVNGEAINPQTDY